ncbi:MAG: haloacid dehalogenase type II [Chloroflexota bacterium]
MARVCVFDVNETLLDLAGLDTEFARLFGDAETRRQWFQQVLQSAFVATVTGAYSDFAAVGRAALAMTAERRGVSLSDGDSQRVLAGMRRLPPHPEVRDALELLRSGGLRLAALTNSPPAAAREQIAHAGLAGYFEQVLSADTARRLKPAPEAYHMAARSLGVSPAGVRLIAAHSWDVAGAMRAGCAAAFVARPGQVLDPLAERPDVIGRTLPVVARQILEQGQRAAGAYTVP